MKEFLQREQGLEAVTDLNINYVIVLKKDWERACSLLNMEESSTEEFNRAKKIYNNLSNKKEGIKHDSSKPRFDLIPADALEEVSKVYTIGANKYGDRNWEKGLSYGRLFGAMMRHAWGWWKGEREDKENKLHHLSSVIFCALALLHYELNSEKFSKFDDRNI